MEFIVIAVVCAILAIICVIIALQLLIKFDWFVGFLTGLGASFLLGLAAFLILAVLNLSTYQMLSTGQSLASLNLKPESPHSGQIYKADITVNGGYSQTLEVEGDTWQLEYIVVNIFGYHFYKIHNLTGHYYSLEQENSRTRIAAAVKTSNLGIDLAKWLDRRDYGFISVGHKRTRSLPLNGSHTAALILDNKKLRIKLLSVGKSGQ